MLLHFEWDEHKRRSNLATHGIDFADLASIFAGETVTVTDDRFDYEERRFLTIGLLKGTVVTVAHTETDDVIRFISARKGTRYEQDVYFRETRH